MKSGGISSEIPPLFLPNNKTENYKGYSYAAYALALCSEQPDLLLLVTKNLYPTVAKRYGTTWGAVERDIRTVVAVAWSRNPALLVQLADDLLVKRPHCAQFLAIAAMELRRAGSGHEFLAGYRAALCMG